MLLALLYEAEIVKIRRRAQQQHLVGDTLLRSQALDRHRHVIARMFHRMVAQQRRQLTLQALQRIRPRTREVGLRAEGGGLRPRIGLPHCRARILCDVWV